MTAEVLAPAITTSSTSRRPPLLVLGLKEAKRMVRSPAFLLLLGFFVLTGGIETVNEGTASQLLDPAAIYEVIVYYCVLWLGLVTYVAAHLVTSSARRTKADQQQAASPVDERGRGLAMCLGVLLGPFAITVGLMTFVAILANGGKVATSDGLHALAVAELAQIAITIAGGGLFGVTLATWLRFPGSLILGFIFLVFATLMIVGSGDVSDTTPWLAPTLTSTEWIDEPWTLVGSQTWHAAYLAGLCALGICAVALKQREGRRPWFICGGCVLLFTVVAALMQS